MGPGPVNAHPRVLRAMSADLLGQLMAFVKAGYNARVSPDVETLLGRPARTLAAYARESKDALARASAA